MEPSETDRRITALIHTGMLASVGVYGVVLVFFRAEISPDATPTRSVENLFPVLAALGIAQFVGATIAGRMLLRSPRSGASGRVRLYFLLRAAAAEAIAVYAFALGFLAAPVWHVLVLFGIGVAALLACAPGKAAWARAMAAGHPRSPGGGGSPA